MWKEISSDNADEVQRQLEAGYDANATRSLDGESLLQYAYEAKAKQSFKVLAKHAAGIELELTDGTRIIHRAAYDKDSFWIQTLIDAGADVDAWSNGSGNREGTPIHFAIIEGCQKNSLLLLQAGACINCPSNQFSSSAFFHAVDHYQWIVAAEMLRLGGSPVDGPQGKRVIDALKQRDFDSERPWMKGFGEFAFELKRAGHGEEAFTGSLWTKKSYDDYLKEGNPRLTK